MRKADKADALSNVANRTQGHFELCSFPARICYTPLLYHSVNFLRGKRKKPLKLKVQVFIKMWLWSKNCVKNKIGGLKTSTPLMLSPALSLLLQFLSKRSRAAPLGGWAGVASLLCVRQKMGQTHCMVPWGCLLLDKTLALFHVSWVYCGYIYLVAFHSQRGIRQLFRPVLSTCSIWQGCLPVLTTFQVQHILNVNGGKTNIAPSSASWAGSLLLQQLKQRAQTEAYI